MYGPQNPCKSTYGRIPPYALLRAPLPLPEGHPYYYLVSHRCFIIVAASFIVFHYVCSYCDCHYSTCDNCIFQCIDYNYDYYNGFHLHGASCTFVSACHVSATTIDPRGHKKGNCWPCHCAEAATWVLDAFSGLCLLCHGYSWDEFSFSDLSFLILMSAMVFAFCFQVPMCLTCSPRGAQVLGFAPPQPFIEYPWLAYMPSDGGP